MSAAQFDTKSIFLCHNSKDKPFVRRVNRELKQVGVRTWFDEAEIKPGDSLVGKIQDGLNVVDCLGAFLSPDSIESNWVQKELNIALTQEIEGKTSKVIPILIGDLPTSDVPLFLSDKSYIDMREPTPFKKGVHELLMELSGEYAIHVRGAIAEVESPDDYSVAFAGLRAMVLQDTGGDPELLANALHRYQVLKRIGVDLKTVSEFVMPENPQPGIDRIIELLKKDLPYPLWEYLATDEVLKDIFRAMGKDV